MTQLRTVALTAAVIIFSLRPVSAVAQDIENRRPAPPVFIDSRDGTEAVDGILETAGNEVVRQGVDDGGNLTRTSPSAAVSVIRGFRARGLADNADRGRSVQKTVTRLRTSAADDEKDEGDVTGYDTAENTDSPDVVFRDADGDGIDDSITQALKDRSRKAVAVKDDFDGDGASDSIGDGYTRGKCIRIFFDENGDGIDDIFLGRGSSQTKGNGHSGGIFGAEEETLNGFGACLDIKRGKTDTLMQGKGMKRRGMK